MSDHISSVSKSCFLSIRDLRRIRNTLDVTTARTIAISLIHYTLDCCNSLFLNFPQSHFGRLQLILNSSARAVSKTPKFAHISSVLKSLHWLKIEQRIQYEVASITYKVLQSEQPSYPQPSQCSIIPYYSLLCHHYSPTSFSWLTSQNNWQVFYPPCSCTLEFFTQTTAAAFGASISWHCYYFFSTTCPVLASVSL